MQAEVDYMNSFKKPGEFTEITGLDQTKVFHTDNIFLYSVYDFHVLIVDGEWVTHVEDVYGRSNTVYDPATKTLTVTKTSTNDNLGIYGAYVDLG